MRPAGRVFETPVLDDSGDSKISGANNYSSCSPNDQLPDVRRSQVPSAGHRRDQYTVISQIRWRRLMETLVDDRQLELNALRITQRADVNNTHIL